MIVAVAGAAHRLALACEDASNDVKYMATFWDQPAGTKLVLPSQCKLTAALKAVATTL